MDIHNFQLSNVFYDNAKEYVTRPVMAARYQPGMENGFFPPKVKSQQITLFDYFKIADCGI